MSKAGQAFICSCCREEHDEAEASYDDQCGGPVCDDCRKSFIKAVAWLKHEGIDRPLDSDDVKASGYLYNRVKKFM